MFTGFLLDLTGGKYHIDRAAALFWYVGLTDSGGQMVEEDSVGYLTTSSGQ